MRQKRVWVRVVMFRCKWVKYGYSLHLLVYPEMYIQRKLDFIHQRQKYRGLILHGTLNLVFFCSTVSYNFIGKYIHISYALQWVLITLIYTHVHARCELPSICTSHSCVLQEIIMIRFSLCSLWMLYAKRSWGGRRRGISGFFCRRR